MLKKAREQIVKASEAQDFDKALEIIAGLYRENPQDPQVVARLGEWLEDARDISMLNAPPPHQPLFGEIADTLAALAKAARGSDDEAPLMSALATAARMMARQRDAVVEESSRRVIELDPEDARHYYSLGLFLKTRGHFAEGMRVNQTAARLAGKDRGEAYDWNLGICATGARESTVALEVWQRLGQKIRPGRFGLPEGGYPQCKVRLAERPLAERTAETDDPGLEETIWIERLSPCHGIIRSVLFQNLGVDYGDVILIDGAPCTYHTYGGKQIPVFPHLATLERSHYRFFDFAGTQEEAEQLARLSADLERDAIVYSHTESYRVLCAACWRDPDREHQHGKQEEKHVVKGRIAAPPDYEPRVLLQHLDAALAKSESCRLYAPDLCEAAGLSERAAFEKRRFQMITG